MPDWAPHLANLYWQLRMHRHLGEAARRFWYRRIDKEKRRLLLTGVDGEELRLYCLFLADPSKEWRLHRYKFYVAQGRLDFEDELT